MPEPVWRSEFMLGSLPKTGENVKQASGSGPNAFASTGRPRSVICIAKRRSIRRLRARRIFGYCLT